MNLFCDVWLLKAITFLSVFVLEPKGKAKGDDTKYSEDEHGDGVVVLDNLVSIANNGANDAIVAQYITDEQGYATQTDVLHPEDKRVCRTQKAQGYNLGY